MTAATHDFRTDILDLRAHRPWPMPAAPWILTQTWHDLLFAHWPVRPDALQALVPAPLDVDRFDGHAWIGIVPFEMTNVAPRAFPALPWLSAFPELNVRTYVTVHGRPGVYFFSLDAANAVAVLAARAGFHLPYHRAAIEVRRASDGTIRYRSRRRSGDARLEIAYRATGDVSPAEPGSLEYFLTERYCLYTVVAGRAFRADIHHPPWPLQPASAEVAVNTMAEAAGISIDGDPALLHFSRRQDAVAWLPARA